MGPHELTSEVESNCRIEVKGPDILPLFLPEESIYT